MPAKKGVFDRYINEEKTFDDYPDLRQDMGLENFDLKGFSDEAIKSLEEQLKGAGHDNVPIKIVGVSLHVLMLNPDDTENKTDIVHTELVAWHKNCGNPKHLLSRSVGEMDADVLKQAKQEKDCDCEGECENQPYKAGKYHGHMYG